MACSSIGCTSVPGSRIYFGKEGESIVILLGGGDKRTRKRDIQSAVERWRDYKARARRR